MELTKLLWLLESIQIKEQIWDKCIDMIKFPWDLQNEYHIGNVKKEEHIYAL